jgi:plastocyanin
VRIDGKELGEQAQGASVTWKAEKAGTYPYTCTIHPSMSGTIVVK